MSSIAFDRTVVPGSPRDGATAPVCLQVYELVTGVATAETLFPTLDPTLSTAPCAWLEFSCDDGAGNPVGLYVIVSSIAIPLAAPNPLGTPDPTMDNAGANPENQCVFVAPGRVWPRRFVLGQSYRLIQLSGSLAFARVEQTSVPFAI